jgi:AcrR family transcriptional regulator
MPESARPRKRRSPDARDSRPRIARRERRRAQSREEILDAARRVVLRDGANVTLDAVAEEVGLTKAALYYYFPSKDALIFELVFSIAETEARAVATAVDAAADGPAAVAAIIRTTVERYAGRMDDFRLAFLYGQMIGSESIDMLPAYFERIRPLNDLTYGAAARKLDQPRGARGAAGVPPRRLAFVAHLAAIGLLTVKGLVERLDDPLLYSDEQLIEDLSRIFAAAASASKRRPSR